MTSSRSFAVASRVTLTSLCLFGFLSLVACTPSPTSQDVTVTAPDGAELRATYYDPGEAGPGVLLLHMCNSDRSAWAGVGSLLAERGIHALALDYRGYGESGGERGETPQESQAIRAEKWSGDIDAALDVLLAQAGVDGERLGAAGGSCGVNEAIQLARRHPEVGTLVLLAGTTDGNGEAYLEQSPWMPLFGSASLDDDGAVDSTRWLLGFSSNPENTFAEYSEGGHGTEMFAVHTELEPRIADWFVEHLVTHPVAATTGTEAQPGPSAELARALREPGGPARMRELLHAAQEAGEGGVENVELPPEGVVNVYGYELLGSGQTAEAIEAFLLNVEAHPDSPNTYDSLADGYLAAGESDLARENAEKVLSLLGPDAGEDTPFEITLREAAETKLEQLRRGVENGE